MNSVAYFASIALREDVITAFVAISAFLIVMAVWRTLLVRDPMVGRLKALDHRRQELRDDLLLIRRRSSKLRDSQVDIMSRVIRWFDLLRSNVALTAAEKLERAGLRSRNALIAYLFLKLVLPLIVGALALVFFQFLNVLGLSGMVRTFICLGIVIVGFYAPDAYLKNTADKRRAQLQKSLPDALDLMVICSEAGLSLDASLVRVAREFGSSNPELADELSLTSIELGFLPVRSRALENLVRRCGLPSIRGLVTTLIQTEKYGTPLSNSLRILTAEFRNDRMMRAEAKAARLPATLTVPMVLFIMPSLFVVLLGPAIIRTIDNMSRL